MEWKQIDVGEIKTTEAVLKNLTTGIRYQFRVTCFNKAFSSEPSFPSNDVQVKDIIGNICIVIVELFFLYNIFFFQKLL